MKILIALDYNPVSEIVADKGYELAQKLSAEVELIHVVTEIGYYGMQYPTFMGYNGFENIEMDNNTRQQLHTVAEDYIKNAALHLKDPTVTTHIETGDTATAILDYIKTSNADLLVMGTHSHSTLEKLFMGSTASKILEKTEIPTYVIPVKRK